MANYNDPLERLTQLDPTTPADVETADKTPAVMRQIKQFLLKFLSVSHKDDGSLKDVGISASQIGAGEVGGADSNSATEPNEIKLGTVSTPDLRDLAVSTTKVADNAITDAKLSDSTTTDSDRAVSADHIKDSAVTTAKLASLAVTTAKIAAKAVTNAELANDAAVDASRAVGSDHIKDAAVITRTIADLNVTVGKFAAQTSAKLLAGTGTGVDALTVAGALTATVSGSSLLFALGGITNGGAGSFAMMAVEKAQNSALVAADFAAALTGTVQHIKWTSTVDPASLISLDANGTFLIKNIGFYFLFVETDFDTAQIDRLILGTVNSGSTGYTTYGPLSNGQVLIGFINTTAINTRFAVIFKDGAVGATVGTAKNKITSESYARLVLLAP